MSQTWFALQPAFVTGLQLIGPPMDTQLPCEREPSGASHWTWQSVVQPVPAPGPPGPPV